MTDASEGIGEVITEHFAEESGSVVLAVHGDEADSKR